MCSFDKELDESEDADAIAREAAKDVKKADQRTGKLSSAITNEVAGCSANAQTIVKQTKRRRRSSAFLSSDLAVNYGAELKILKNLSTTIMNNNNVGDVKMASSLIKKSSNIHVSMCERALR